MKTKEILKEELSDLKYEEEKLVNFINTTLEKLSTSKARLSTYPILFKVGKKDFTEADLSLIKSEIDSHSSIVIEAQRLLSELSVMIKEIDDQLLFIYE